MPAATGLVTCGSRKTCPDAEMPLREEWHLYPPLSLASQDRVGDLIRRMIADPRAVFPMVGRSVGGDFFPEACLSFGCYLNHSSLYITGTYLLAIVVPFVIVRKMCRLEGIFWNDALDSGRI